MFLRLTIGAIVLLLGLVACGSPDETTAETPDSSTTTTAPTTTSSTPVSEETMPGHSEAVAAATADLAERLGVPESEIVLVEAKAVTWPDGSLGCPEEGNVYTQALVDGGQVLLSYDERIYDYRSDSAGSIRFCPSDEKDGGREFLPPPRDS